MIDQQKKSAPQINLDGIALDLKNDYLYYHALTGHMATISISGSFSADTGDIFSFFYNFGVDLTTSVPVHFTLEGTANTQFGPISASDSGTLMPGDHQYSGMNATPPTPIGLTGTYTGTLTFDVDSIATSGGLAPTGATTVISLTIPTGGLDFQVGPTAIPEPSTYALVGLGLGALILMAQRRLLA